MSDDTQSCDPMDYPTPLGPGRLHVPVGHYYSPIPSSADVARALSRAGRTGRTLPGIDLREVEQMRLLDHLRVHYEDLGLAEEPGRDRFYLANTWFTYADAVCYALLLRHLAPRRVVEVGTGFSSALALDVDERFLAGRTRFTFIDPDPGRIIELARPGELAGRLRPVPVQEVPLELFQELAAGDILFIDSSHVLKAGSDVQHLIDEVLPGLAAGVYVHFHDVFYPFEYPATWLHRGCAMNEAYAVRALLQGGRYRIVLFNHLLRLFHRPWLERTMPLLLPEPFDIGGIWLETLG